MQNLRQPNHGLEINLRPLGPQPGEHLAPVLLPRAIELSKEVLSEFVV
jgi:hypothetical protein